MAAPIDFRQVIEQDAPIIVDTAKRSGISDVACLIVPLEQLRANNVPVPLLELMAKLKQSDPALLVDRYHRALMCVAVPRVDLPKLTGVDEIMEHIGQSIHTLVLWIVCFDGDDRKTHDLHIAGPTFN